MPIAPAQEGGQEDLHPSPSLHLPGVAAVPISATGLGPDFRGLWALKSVHSTLAIVKGRGSHKVAVPLSVEPHTQTGKPGLSR